MFAKILFISILCWLNAVAIKHSEFPQWDQTPWVVQNVNENVTLPCTHDEYYPFNDSSAPLKTVWILPKHTSYLHLEPGMTMEGWSATNKTLTIRNSLFNVLGTADGMYVCAVLARVPFSNITNLYSWYYLRWGVGLYKNVAAMNPGGIERYARQFTVAGVAVAVYAVLAIGFGLTVYFRYDGEAHDEEEEEDEEEAGKSGSVYTDPDFKENVVYF